MEYVGKGVESIHDNPLAFPSSTYNWTHLPNCSYRYDSNHRTIQIVSLYLDGPLTFLAAILALCGAKFAFKFLRQAGLNAQLTAALYSLCLCDACLMVIIILYHSIEALGILLTDVNVMWNEQVRKIKCIFRSTNLSFSRFREKKERKKRDTQKYFSFSFLKT